MERLAKLGYLRRTDVTQTSGPVSLEECQTTQDLEETRKNKKKRKAKKNPKPSYKMSPAEGLDLSSSEAEEAEALSFSLTAESEAARDKAPSNEALNNSLSSIASLSSLAEPKGSSKGDRNNSLSLIEDEDGSSLSDCSEEVIPPRSLSPSQFVGSLMKHSGSKEKLLVHAATAPLENLGFLFPQLSLCCRIRQQPRKKKRTTRSISG
jgi:hypothetical protein